MSLVPKMLAVMGVLLLMLAPALRVLTEFTHRIFDRMFDSRPLLSRHRGSTMLLPPEPSRPSASSGTSARSCSRRRCSARGELLGLQDRADPGPRDRVVGLAGGALETDPSGIQFALLGMREAAIGLFFALLMHLVMLGARVGADMVGNEMAFTMAGAVDPMTGTQTPTIGRIYEILFLLAMLSVDAHHWVLVPRRPSSARPWARCSSPAGSRGRWCPSSGSSSRPASPSLRRWRAPAGGVGPAACWRRRCRRSTCSSSASPADRWRSRGADHSLRC